MRTTIRLDDQLMADTKKVAAETHRTLTAVIEDALREMLARKQGSAERPTVRLKTVSGNGLQPGVDLDDSASLTDLMDKVDGPDRR